MTKRTVTNTARGGRGFSVFVNGKDDKEGVETVIVEPGQTLEDLAICNEDSRAFKAMVESRELIVGDAPDPDEEPDPEEEAERNEARFLNDPKFLADRAAAEAALRNGLADPLPRATAAPRERSERAASKRGRAAKSDE